MKIKSTIMTGALALGLSSAALAAPPERSLRLGVYGGLHMALDDWDLDEPQGTLGEPPLMGGILGLRFGGEVTRWLGLELDVGVVLHPSGSDELNTALRITGDALVYPFHGPITPFLKVGAGAYTNVGGDRGTDSDFEIHYGLGLRAVLSEAMALRVDVVHALTDAYDPEDDLASNLIATVGLDFYLIHDTDEPSDRDGDGVVDGDDRCPDVPGPASNQGCPTDTDRDGVFDPQDQCPDEPGPASNNGCPLDSDGDGILDAADRCPNEPGPASNEGCPLPLDSDGDGILDSEDRCPYEAGPASGHGCPEASPDAEVPPQTIVRFGTNRDDLASRKDLDAMLGYLKRHPEARLAIEGHTDSQGDAEYNQGLSIRRANSVKQAFINEGIEASRITTRGYGQSRPVAGNDTEEGRALNRRVEVLLIR